jgi:hypothetical protein
VPNIIVKPDLGIIYTTSTSKVAEHGGLSAATEMSPAF